MTTDGSRGPSSGLREGLEQQLALLESAQQEALLDDDPISACCVCYMPQDLCACSFPELWPIGHAINRLKQVLRSLEH